MKIAILINTLHNGYGMDNVAILQAMELIQEGHQVSIFTFDSSVSINNVEIIKLGWPKDLLTNYFYRMVFPLNFLKIHSISKKLSNYDLVMAHFYPISHIAYYSKKKYPHIKYLFYNHGLIDNKFNPLLKRLYEYFFSILMNKSISNVDYVISISAYINNILKCPCTNRKIIYNKVDCKRFLYSHENIRQDILDIKDSVYTKSGPIYLYVGVLSFSKGIPLLINCYKEILEQYPDAKLFLAGQNSYEFNLLDYTSKIAPNKIFYFGHVSYPNLGVLYKICDVYVSASTFESFNFPAVEAQSFGKPVVAFDVGAHSEVIKNGETGILAKPFDINEFVKAMINVYKNKQFMGVKAKEWAFRFSANNQYSESVSKFISELNL